MNVTINGQPLEEWLDGTAKEEVKEFISNSLVDMNRAIKTGPSISRGLSGFYRPTKSSGVIMNNGMSYYRFIIDYFVRADKNGAYSSADLSKEIAKRFGIKVLTYMVRQKLYILCKYGIFEYIKSGDSRTSTVLFSFKWDKYRDLDISDKDVFISSVYKDFMSNSKVQDKMIVENKSESKDDDIEFVESKDNSEIPINEYYEKKVKIKLDFDVDIKFNFSFK